jgi:hypothetical protein
MRRDNQAGAEPYPADDFPGERLPDDGSGYEKWLLSGGVLVHRPDHPLASPKHGTVWEHRMVIYDAGISELEPGVEVHHKNGNRTDNRLENLVVLPRSKHHALHGLLQRGKPLFTYRLHLTDGTDLGEATYSVEIHPGQEIIFGGGQRFRVLDVVLFDEEDESPFVGMLKVEAA